MPPRNELWQAPNPGYKIPKLKATDPTTLTAEGIPDREWIVPDWIPRGALSMMSGDGGLGKTLLGQQLATAVATGNTEAERHSYRRWHYDNNRPPQKRLSQPDRNQVSRDITR